MAQWNPYYGVPNQTSEAVYEDQNLSSPYYYGVNTQYASTPLQPINYNNAMYATTGVFSNFESNPMGNVYNVHDLEAQQFARNYAASSREGSGKPASGSMERENANAVWNNTTNSTLHATAAEFKPSTSAIPNSQISSQTYYRNNQKSNVDMRGNTGAVRKNNISFEPKNNRKGLEPPASNEPGKPQGSRPNSDPRSERPYGTNSGQNFNKSYNRDRNNYNNRGFNKREEYNNPEVENNQRYGDQTNQKYDYKNSRYENRDNNYRGNYRKQEYDKDHGETAPRPNNHRQSRNQENYGRNYRNYPERNSSERNSYSRDNYNKSNIKNSYRNIKYENTGYENWRTGPGPSNQQEKEVASRGKAEKDENPKNKFYDRDRKPHRNDKRLEKYDDISQRDRLTEQVNKGTLECLVCCDRVKQQDKIWYCEKCYHIFHFRCIIKWGKSSKDDNGWRCPACQHVSSEVPTACFCYCGKMSDPQFNPTDTAHSCGDVCGKMGIKPGCIHRCNLLCHPGPCPKCEALISRHCNCGATTQMVKCSAETVLVCAAICGKFLNCGVHKCEKICHGGGCAQCLENIHQVCFCGKAERTIPCSKDQKDISYYSCEEKCSKLLTCGNHKCPEICHPGDCPPCERAPNQIKTCPCGKSELEVVRTSCLDPIPCCGRICGKRYPLCGTPSNPHICKSDCHEGECPSCPLTTFIRCRCGHVNCELTCFELATRTSDVTCEKKCTKKRSCGRHKCNQLCCIDLDHICPLPCNHTLSCGNHRCEQTCHNGRCQPCWRISFDELYCNCGAAVIMPPVPCGAKKPKCIKPCTREHPCEHEPLHTCHNLSECPPCTVLTSKYCFGKHERRNTIPCHQEDFSCGLPCGKNLSCDRHKCQLACHKGPCLKEGQNCSQPCNVSRESCGHACGLPCHDPPCQDSPCKESVKVTCQCGLRSSTRACVDMAGEYQRIAVSMLASKMADMQLGLSIDIGDIVGTTTKKQTLKTLECNDDCRLVERNRRLAIGLQIRNPDLSAKLTPRYSDFMRLWAKKDSAFCQMVHEKLTELVQLAKQSKQKSRSFSFPSMNREKRQFVHEYCEHFGCESAAYDQEPNRNVVATAARDKAWLPSCSLLELIQRESGQRKVPGPILNRPLGVSKTLETVSLRVPTKTANSTTSFSSAVQQTQNKSPDDIDYFNFPSGNK